MRGVLIAESSRLALLIVPLFSATSLSWLSFLEAYF
jgi:hypothetical protein